MIGFKVILEFKGLTLNQNVQSWIFNSTSAATTNANNPNMNFKSSVTSSLAAHLETWIFKRYLFVKNAHAQT